MAEYIERETAKAKIREKFKFVPARIEINEVLNSIPAADAIEELQATLCNWCAVCPEDKRDLSTCEIYESCRAKPPKEE